MYYRDQDDNDQTVFHNLDANRHFNQDYISLRLDCEIVGQNPIFQLEGETLVVGYLTPDSDVMEFDFSEGESLKVFRSQGERDTYFMAMQENDRNPLLVERYSHSADHYSVIGTKDYPDRQFDVVPSAVYTPSTDMLDELKSGAIDEKELIQRANLTLDSYSDWANGNVYGAVIEKFKYDADAEVWEPSEASDSVWGMIGHEAAEAELKSMMQFEEIPEPKRAVQKDRTISNDGPSM